MRWLFMMFIGIPIIEMILLIKIGGAIGAIPTIGLVLLTAVVGVALLKRQGLATINVIQVKLANGEIPGQELLEGAMLLIGGAFLLTPGFVTDALGFSLLLPRSRRMMVWFLLDRGLLNQLRSNPPGNFQTSRHQPESKSSITIEGEFRNED